MLIQLHKIIFSLPIIWPHLYTSSRNFCVILFNLSLDSRDGLLFDFFGLFKTENRRKNVGRHLPRTCRHKWGFSLKVCSAISTRDSQAHMRSNIWRRERKWHETSCFKSFSMLLNKLPCQKACFLLSYF